MRMRSVWLAMIASELELVLGVHDSEAREAVSLAGNRLQGQIPDLLEPRLAIAIEKCPMTPFDPDIDHDDRDACSGDPGEL
jgi:hypothetical protein